MGPIPWRWRCRFVFQDLFVNKLSLGQVYAPEGPGEGRVTRCH